jgi:hypothetical protein
MAAIAVGRIEDFATRILRRVPGKKSSRLVGKGSVVALSAPPVAVGWPLSAARAMPQR